MNSFELLSNRLCKFIIYDQLFSIMPVNSDDVFKYQSTPSPIFKVHLIKKLHAGLYMLLKLNIILTLKKSEAIYYCSSCSNICWVLTGSVWLEISTTTRSWGCRFSQSLLMPSRASSRAGQVTNWASSSGVGSWENFSFISSCKQGHHQL